MREIKYRGKRIDNGEWVYGCYVNGIYNDYATIIQRHVSEITENNSVKFDNCFRVVPKTVGQYTGLKDKKGVEIYKGDILQLVGGTCNFLPCGIYKEDQSYKIGDKMIVQNIKSGFTLCGLNMYDCDIPNRVGKVNNYTFWNHQSSLKIIGNIYENPELLEQK